MISKSICLIALSVFAVQAQNVRPDDEKLLEHAMQVARENVRRLELSTPNFVCTEQILSQLFMDKKLRKETRAQALLTTTRITKDDKGIFTETRTQMRINGKATSAGQISGPFVWGGGPGYDDLHILFNSDVGATCMDHKLVGPVKLDDKDALLIETHAPQNIENDPECGEFRSDSADKIWLEPGTFNVMRVESHDPPADRIPGADLTLSVDYKPVKFDGAEYWVPSHLLSFLDFPGTPRHFRYEVFFTDYHKFGAESSFHVDPEP